VHYPVRLAPSGQSAVLCDEPSLVRERRTFDDARYVLARIRDGDVPVAGRMAEHPEERRLAVRVLVQAETELEQPASELAPELCITDAEPVPLQ